MLITPTLAPRITPHKVTHAEAGRILSMGRKSIRNLDDSGYLPLPTDIPTITELASRPIYHIDAGPVPILRPGYSLRAGMQSPEFLHAMLSCGWRCDPKIVLEAGYIVVTISSFVVGVIEVTDILHIIRIPPGELRGSSPSNRYVFSGSVLRYTPQIVGMEISQHPSQISQVDGLTDMVGCRLAGDVSARGSALIIEKRS